MKKKLVTKNTADNCNRYKEKNLYKNTGQLDLTILRFTAYHLQGTANSQQWLRPLPTATNSERNQPTYPPLTNRHTDRKMPTRALHHHFNWHVTAVNHCKTTSATPTGYHCTDRIKQLKTVLPLITYREALFYPSTSGRAMQRSFPQRWDGT